MIGLIEGIYWGYIGDNGKEHGKDYSIIGSYILLYTRSSFLMTSANCVCSVRISSIPPTAFPLQATNAESKHHLAHSAELVKSARVRTVRSSGV